MSLPQLGEPLRHPLVVHDDTLIVLYPFVLLIHSATMLQPPTLAATDANMSQHAML